MRGILKRPRAADDLIELWDYIAEDSVTRGMRSSTMSTNGIAGSLSLQGEMRSAMLIALSAGRYIGSRQGITRSPPSVVGPYQGSASKVNFKVSFPK
jgi:hypothetical protein